MIRFKSVALAMAAMVAAGAMAPVPVLAQEATGELADPGKAAAIAFAEERGEAMYWYDQAAWHASDALVELIEKSPELASIDGEPVGFIVVPGDGSGLLDTYFVATKDGEFRYFARYTVAGSTVVDQELAFDTLPALPPLAQRMMRARATGLAALVDAEAQLCTDNRPNTLVMPPDADGTIAVYLLTPQSDLDSYPIGGHWRANVAADGTVATRRYTKSCLELAFGPSQETGDTVVAVGTISLLDDVPTDVHVFVARYLPVPMQLGTLSRDVYEIDKGEVTFLYKLED